jgi:hypothetical protein
LLLSDLTDISPGIGLIFGRGNPPVVALWGLPIQNSGFSGLINSKNPVSQRNRVLAASAKIPDAR